MSQTSLALRERERSRREGAGIAKACDARRERRLVLFEGELTDASLAPFVTYEPPSRCLRGASIGGLDSGAF